MMIHFCSVVVSSFSFLLSVVEGEVGVCPAPIPNSGSPLSTSSVVTGADPFVSGIGAGQVAAATGREEVDVVRGEDTKLSRSEEEVESSVFDLNLNFSK